MKLNDFLTNLFNCIGIDVDHLVNIFLSKDELNHLNKILTSEEDFNSKKGFYTNEHGTNLECLLNFLVQTNVDHSYTGIKGNKERINELLQGKGRDENLIELYTSSTISGNYDCFRFDLSKFPKTYISTGQTLILYRIGRAGEKEGNLGNSWSASIEGVRTYWNASSLNEDEVKDTRKIFQCTIDDNQVLFKGDEGEEELVLIRGFKPITLIELVYEEVFSES